MQEGRKIYFNADKSDDIAAFAIAAVAAAAFHAAVVCALPAKWNFSPREKVQTAIEILPPEISRKTPEFVEANPYANSLKPDDKAPVSFKSQRAADEIADKTSSSPRPFVKGEDKKYKKIVSGTSDELDRIDPSRVQRVLERPLADPSAQQAAAQQKTQAQPAQAAAQAQAQSQAAVQAQAQGAEKASKASAQAQAADKAARPSLQPAAGGAQERGQAQSAIKTIAKPDKIDAAVAQSDPEAIVVPEISQTKTEKPKPAAKTAKMAEAPQAAPQPAAQVQQAAQSPAIPAPRQRPRLSMKIPAGPLMDNNRAASQTGLVAVDSRFSEFGAYQQRMIEAISRQWNLLGRKYDLSAEVGSHVFIEFSLNTEGELVDFRVSGSSASNIGTGLCEQSILSTAPYGAWTQEMVNTLGQQPQQVRINFMYR